MTDQRDTPDTRTPSAEGCPFCEIALNGGRDLVYADTNVIVFEPLNPVVPGHLLVVSRVHVTDFTSDSETSALVMRVAARLGYLRWPCNLITSAGEDATQSVYHLHVHIVPRQVGDGLRLPWTPEPAPLGDATTGAEPTEEARCGHGGEYQDGRHMDCMGWVPCDRPPEPAPTEETAAPRVVTRPDTAVRQGVTP